MDKRKGMILVDLTVYLIAGLLLVALTVNTFKVIYLGYRNFIEINDVKSDFINVSQRIKFDLLKDIESIEIYKNAVRFKFNEFSTPAGETYEVKDYLLKMDRGRLSYVVNGQRVVGMDLSDLIRDISIEVDGEIINVRFQYDNYSFERSYRIDTIKEKCIYNIFLADLGILSDYGILSFGFGCCQ